MFSKISIIKSQFSAARRIGILMTLTLGCRCRPAPALPHPGALLSCLLRSRCHRRSRGRSRRVNCKPPNRASPRGVGDVPQPPRPPTRTHTARPFTWLSGRAALYAHPRDAHTPCVAFDPDLFASAPPTQARLTRLADTLPFAFFDQFLAPLRRLSTSRSQTSSECQQAQARCIRRPFSISPRSMPVRAFRLPLLWCLAGPCRG